MLGQGKLEMMNLLYFLHVRFMYLVKLKTLMHG